MCLGHRRNQAFEGPEGGRGTRPSVADCPRKSGTGFVAALP